MMEDLNLYEIIGFFLFIIVCMYNFKEFQITSEVEQPNFVRHSRESLERKVRKRKKHLIRSIQNGIIKFTKDEYLSCRVPLGIASEARFKNGNIKEMWCYTIEFENDKFKIEFVAQIRANMVIVKPVGKKKKEILSFVDQTLQHPDIFHDPHDIKCKCSAAKLRSILNYVDEIRDQYEGRRNVC
jgi:hypothetical protein